jgi:hypothetical protein
VAVSQPARNRSWSSARCHRRWRTSTPSSPLRVSTPSQRTTSPVPSLPQLPSRYIRRAYLPSPCAFPQLSNRASKALASFWVAERTSGKRRASRRPPPRRMMALASRAVKRPRMSPHLMWAVHKMPPHQRRSRCQIRPMDSLARLLLQVASAGRYPVRNIICVPHLQLSLLDYRAWKASQRRCRQNKERLHIFSTTLQKISTGLRLVYKPRCALLLRE